MADDDIYGTRGKNWQRTPFDRNRDGVDDDIDRKPGNSSESARYANQYDYGSQQEASVLPERSQQLRLAEAERLRARQQLASEEMLGAQSRVQFLPDLGKFIIPRENTWAAHARLVKEDRTDLHFDPGKYPYFDAIIAERCGIEALSNPAHKDYKKYEGLRTNLEVLRNDLFGFYLKDGTFDPGDEQYLPHLVGIAKALGDGLANDRWHLRPFTRSISVDVAGVEAVGAAEMYQHLLAQQENYGLFSLLAANIKSQFGLETRAWGLPPLEETPFSPANMSKPAPHQGVFYSEEELINTCASPSMQEKIASKKKEDGFRDRLAQERLAETLVPGYKSPT
jgi:hypothetical protein